MEIEIRAKLNSEQPSLLESKITELGGALKKASEQSDVYYKHKTDIDRNLVFRVRQKDGKAELTLKAKAKGNDTAWPDVDLPLGDPESLVNILLGNEYIEVVRIDKTRKSYELNGFEVNIDLVENLGDFVEVEGRGNDDERTQVEASIRELLSQLGVQESQIVLKGYVPLMLEANGG